MAYPSFIIYLRAALELEKLGAGVARRPFSVWLFRPHSHAGLSRRTMIIYSLAVRIRCGLGPEPTVKANISVLLKPDILTLRPHARKSVLTMRCALSYELSKFGLGDLKYAHEVGDRCGTLR